MFTPSNTPVPISCSANSLRQVRWLSHLNEQKYRHSLTIVAELCLNHCCRYEEDVYPNNHTSVWGSWWEAGQWGYCCCHQTHKNSYCTGEAGIGAAEAQADQMQLNIDRKVQEDQAREASGNALKVCSLVMICNGLVLKPQHA